MPLSHFAFRKGPQMDNLPEKMAVSLEADGMAQASGAPPVSGGDPSDRGMASGGPNPLNLQNGRRLSRIQPGRLKRSLWFTAISQPSHQIYCICLTSKELD